MPSNFPSCPCTVSWLGRVAPLAGTPLCRFSNNGTPRHYTVSEPTSSLSWGVPSLATPPQRSRGRLASQAPFRGSPVPLHCPRGPWRPGPASAGHPCPLRYPGPPWALGLPRPTSPVPGVPTKQNSTSHSHTPSPSTGLLHPSEWVSSLHSPQQQNDLHFVNLTNPLTHFTLTPGSLGRESLLPPITHRTMHSPITPFTQTRWPHSLNMSPPHNSSTHTHTSLNPSILLTASPNYLVLPRHPLHYSTSHLTLHS